VENISAVTEKNCGSNLTK